MSPFRRLRQGRFALPAYKLFDLGRQLACAALSRRPLSLQQDLTPFFIIGSGRSGTTLMRAVLISHGDVAIPPESYVIPSVIRTYRSLGFLPWADLCRIIVGRFESRRDFAHWEVDLQAACREAMDLPPERRDLASIIDSVFRCYASQHWPGARLWGDKSPFNTSYAEWLDQVFPSARYIHLLRDGRDVVNSFKHSGLGISVSMACDDWQHRVRTARRLGRRVGASRYIEVRYENLVQQPREEITRVCGFLGLEFKEAMLHHEHIVPRLRDVVELPHYASVHRSINRCSIGTWRHGLTASEQAYVQQKLGRDLERLGY